MTPASPLASSKAESAEWIRASVTCGAGDSGGCYDLHDPRTSRERHCSVTGACSHSLSHRYTGCLGQLWHFKRPRRGGLNSRHLFLTLLEAGRLDSRCFQGRLLVGILLLAGRQPLTGTWHAGQTQRNSTRHFSFQPPKDVPSPPTLCPHPMGSRPRGPRQAASLKARKHTRRASLSPVPPTRLPSL